MGRARGKRPGRESRKRGSGRSWWFYTTLAMIALAGTALILASIRSSQGPPRLPGLASPTGADRTTGVEFPARYDSVGISVGDPDAPVVIREFADYECPACAIFSGAAKRVRETYVEAGQVRFVLFDVPIVSVHPHALPAAMAARCAGDQGAYWAMHDALFDRQIEWSESDRPEGLFVEYADELGLDGARLRECLESDAKLEAVEASLSLAEAIGVRSTPTVIIDDVVLGGSPTYSSVAEVIEERLATAETP